MKQRTIGSYQKFRSPAVYTAIAVVGLCWAYIAQGCGQMVMGLYDRGYGRISAVVFFVIVPLTGVVLSVGIPIWFLRKGSTLRALTTVLVSAALLGGGVLSFFRANGL